MYCPIYLSLLYSHEALNYASVPAELAYDWQSTDLLLYLQAPPAILSSRISFSVNFTCWLWLLGLIYELLYPSITSTSQIWTYPHYSMTTHGTSFCSQREICEGALTSRAQQSLLWHNSEALEWQSKAVLNATISDYIALKLGFTLSVQVWKAYVS